MAMSIKAARVNANLTQDYVCEELKKRGYTTAVSTLVSWKRNRTFPTVQVFKTLCEIYGCTMDDISVPEKLT